jgi:maltooligosyltrehalose trehalohydrolase
MPGVADVYQGTEELNLMLVDPDNRGAVDFRALEERLDRIRYENYDGSKPLGNLDNHLIDYSYYPETIAGRKFLVTYAAIQLRKDYLNAFVGPDSGYMPLSISSDCAIGFARTFKGEPRVITLVTRFSGTLEREDGWGGHIVTLPKLATGYNRWVDRLTGRLYKPGANRLVDIFDRYPVAFLEPAQGGVKKNNLRLWAPNAQKVDAYIADPRTVDETLPLSKILEQVEYKKIPMRPIERESPKYADFGFGQNEDGWWYTTKTVKANRDYYFSVDGGPKIPDPRSARQIFGVEGFSRTTEISQFRFTDLDWAGIDPTGKTIYELHIGTFTPEGTFDAALSKLPYLKSLGVDIVEIMPISTFDGNFGWGYDGADLYSIYEPYGGPLKFQKFVNEAHNLGIGVCLDVVYNHLGPVGDYLKEVGPYYTDAHKTPWGPSFNFDQEYSWGVRTWVIDHIVRLFEKFHVDALRLDATHEIHDDSRQHILALMAETVNAFAKSTSKKITLIAESDSNDIKLLQPLDEDGYGIGMQWADDFHHALYSYLSGENRSYYQDFGTLGHLKKALKQGWVYDNQYSEFRKKSHGTDLPEHFDLRRFVVCFSNHDQIGNRGLGDRPSVKMSNADLKIASALTILSPFTPLIFQGEEWGASTPFQFFADYQDEAVQNACRVGRANEFKDFGWGDFYGEGVQIPDPISWETFEKCKLNWNEVGGEEHLDLFMWYKRLFEIRKKYIGDDPITSQDVEVRTTSEEDGDTLMLAHQGIIVVANFSDSIKALGVKTTSRTPRIIASSSQKTMVSISGMIKISPRSVAVLSCTLRE